MSIYVGNLAYGVTQDELSKVFAEHGTVKSLSLPTDRETGKVRGFAFIEMGAETEETAAIEALDGAEWMGRDMRVSKARPREDNKRSFSAIAVVTIVMASADRVAVTVGSYHVV